jgi:hypothetical protein
MRILYIYLRFAQMTSTLSVDLRFALPTAANEVRDIDA